MRPPEEVHLIQQWVAKAEEDYRNAEYVLTLEEDCPVGTVCFHSQQCVEKYLKALLICQCLPVPRSHDLLDLHKRIPPRSRPDLSKESLAVLNRYAVEARYPGDWGMITRAEAQEAFNIARAVRDAARQELSKEMGPIEGL